MEGMLSYTVSGLQNWVTEDWRINWMLRETGAQEAAEVRSVLTKVPNLEKNYKDFTPI